MKIEIELPPALDTEIRHNAKMNRIDVDQAIINILKIYLRGQKHEL